MCCMQIAGYRKKGSHQKALPQAGMLKIMDSGWG